MRPSRLMRVVAVAACVAPLAAACYPDFQFGPEGTGGAFAGDDGSTGPVGPRPTSGATTGSAGGGDASTSSTGTMETTGEGPTSAATTNASTVATSTSSGSTTPTPQVPCGPYSQATMSLVTCNPFEVCCYHLYSASMDDCKAGACGSSYITIFCDGPEDCEAGQVCCGGFDETIFGLDFVGPIACKDQGTCTGDDLVMCHGDGDCAAAGVGGTCQMLFGDDGYDTAYKACQ